MIAGMIAGVKQLYDGFEQERREWAASGVGRGTVRNSALKVGRNDPCPCGSGKKLKKCCGQVTIH